MVVGAAAASERQSVMQRTEATIDPHALVCAGEEYRRLRRRYFQFFLGGVMSFAVFAGPLIAYGDNLHRAVVGVLGALTAVFGVICWGGGWATWITLMNWRCPRCGKRFILSFSNSLPTNNCKHCGLYLGRRTAA
jgi:hypothetical protein